MVVLLELDSLALDSDSEPIEVPPSSSSPAPESVQASEKSNASETRRATMARVYADAGAGAATNSPGQARMNFIASESPGTRASSLRRLP